MKMKHRGEILEGAVRQSGLPISKLARRMGKSRRHLYNLFENPQVSWDVIFQVGKIIHHDFSTNFPEMARHFSTSDNIAEDAKASYNNNKEKEDCATYWKNKYLKLLEKYNKLLEEKI